MMKSLVVDYNFNGTQFQLREPADMSWLKDLGEVFCVFDQQDSGNISFGVIIANQKKFVKYAGARTLEYEGTVDDAILRLKSGVPNYHNLIHPNLIKLEKHYETVEGYVAIFDWAEGECLHPHWAFTPYEKIHHLNSPYKKYRDLKIEKRIQSLNTIFSFIAHTELNKYVAIDFYDGSILYDFTNDKTTICDIDFFSKAPVLNTIGEDFWGSSRFKSPEEYQLGATIDSQTNVYTLGAIAFALIGGRSDFSFDKWEANDALYKIATKAMEFDKGSRYYSVHDFYKEWKEAMYDFVEKLK
jgi:serine/threonine-protein kinase